MPKRPSFPEYDLHPSGARVDDAVAQLNRIVSSARGGGANLFAVITGYGSSGGTAMIKGAVLAACRQYLRQHLNQSCCLLLEAVYLSVDLQEPSF